MQSFNKHHNLLLQQKDKQYWGRLNKYRLNAALKYSGPTILDIGCSTGQYVITLKNKGYQIVGVDLLNHTEWQALKSNNDLSQGDILHLPFPDHSFDTILAFEVIEHIEQANLAIQEIYRVTKRNVIVTVPNCQEPEAMIKSGLAFRHWVDSTHCQMFTKTLLYRLLEVNEFEIIDFQFINPILPLLLVLDSFHLPVRIARLIAAFFNKVPWIKKYPMTLLIVGEKKYT